MLPVSLWELPKTTRTGENDQKAVIYARIEIVVKVFFFEFGNKKHMVQKLRFPDRDPGSGRYREVREAHRNRFHLFSSILVSVARSYDQKSPPP